MATYTWRKMLPSDISVVHLLACQIHSTLPESEDVYWERLSLFPDGCLVLVNDKNVIHGYAVSHPIRRGVPPALNSLLGEISADADQYYIHDVVVWPVLRGKGFAREAIEKLIALAEEKGFETTCLISVYGTSAFWARFGFVPESVDEVFSKETEQLRGSCCVDAASECRRLVPCRWR